ncbi:MAG: hypothetical protein KKD44_07305 [Proteobacteria bacterium]|nr:hypothetical protein [Pseudomonadota bacterium]
MKLIPLFITFLISFHANAAFCDDMSDYRYNPFQFIYSEYNYKADKIKISKIQTAPEGLTKVNFFGLSAFVPAQYVKTIDENNPNRVIFKSDNNIFFIEREKELRSGCIDEQVASRNKDFCSAFNSTKDLFYKFFTLTADDLKKSKEPPSVGVLWIIHQKGFLFENTKDIHIYEGDKFTAFVQVRKDNNESSIEKDITLFHDKLSPDHLSMGTNIKDDKFLNNFLETLE